MYTRRIYWENEIHRPIRGQQAALRLGAVETMQRQLYDVVVIGGGVMGSSVAAHLAMGGLNRVAVIERDFQYKYASSALSASGMRQQFALKENILLSRHSCELLKNPNRLEVNGQVPDFQVPKLINSPNSLHCFCAVHGEWIFIFS